MELLFDKTCKLARDPLGFHHVTKQNGGYFAKLRHPPKLLRNLISHKRTNPQDVLAFCQLIKMSVDKELSAFCLRVTLLLRYFA